MSSLHEPGQVNRREESSELDDFSLFLGLSVLADDAAGTSSTRKQRKKHPSFSQNPQEAQVASAAAAAQFHPKFKEPELAGVGISLPERPAAATRFGRLAPCSQLLARELRRPCRMVPHALWRGASMSTSTALRCSGTASHVCSWTRSPMCEQHIHRTTAPSARPRESRSQKRPKDVQQGV